MNNKFQFKITAKISSPHHPFVVIYGDWLTGRVSRGNVLTLVSGKDRHLLHICAVDLGDRPGKLVLACGRAQKSVCLAKAGDILEACTTDGWEASLHPVSFMTEKDHDDYLANEEFHYLRARAALVRSQEYLGITRNLWKDESPAGT